MYHKRPDFINQENSLWNSAGFDLRAIAVFIIQKRYARIQKKKDKIYRLTWEKHIDKICAKVGAGIGVTRRMRPFVPLETLKLIYNALVQPYFDYCSPLWDNCGGGLKDKLQRVQNRAVRVITGSTFDIRSDDVQIMLGIRRPEIY